MEIDSGKKFNLEFNNLLILYRHGVILACILVVFFVVIPQFQQYLGSQEELKTQMQKLEILKSNYNFLTNLDSSKSNTDFSALTLALPSGKDFAGIMNAVSYASAKTGVAVGDFEFSVGSLSGGNTEGVSAYPSIKIDINLVGNTQSVVQFIQELYKTAPACEVTNIKTGGNSGSITALFYYKPFPQQNVDDSAPITVLSARDLALIKTVSAWNNSSNQVLMPLIPSLISGGSTPAASLGNGSSPF
jgi:Tfp pilus assembly protein PilO